MKGIGRKWLCRLLALAMVLPLLSAAAPSADAADQKHFKVLLWSPDTTIYNGNCKTEWDALKYHYEHMSDLGAVVDVVTKTSGALDPSELDGVQLVFILALYLRSDSPEGKNVLAAAPLLEDYVKRGGRVILNGENHNLVNGNALLSALAAKIGGNFSIGTVVDSETNFELNTAEASSLTDGVDPSLIMAIAVNNITMTGNARWVVRTVTDKSAFIVEQEVGQGHITAIADINWIADYRQKNSYADYSQAKNTNVRRLLYNLVKDSAQHMAEVAGSCSVTLVPNGGTIAAGKDVTSYTVGTGAELPAAADVTKDGYTFGGWYETEDFTGSPVTSIGADATGNKIFYAKWTHNVIVEVKTDYKVVLELALKKGAETLKSAEVEVEGEEKPYSVSYKFTDVPDGYYNVVAKQTDGDGKEHTMTVAVPLTAGHDDTEPVEIVMPSGDTNSILTVTPNTRPVVAGNLEKEAAAHGQKERVEDGHTVTIEMTVKKDDESVISTLPATTQTAIPAIRINAQAAKPAGREMAVEFMDIDVKKTVDTAEPVAIPETDTIIEFAIPFEVEGKDIWMWRYHGDSVDELRKAASKAAAEDREGWFYPDAENDVIYLYAKKFSTYAIGSAVKAPVAPVIAAPVYIPINVPAPALTIPVSGDENTVRVNASISNGVINVQRPEAGKLERVIGGTVKTGTVVIDASAVDEEIADVSIPIETLREIEKAVADPSNDAQDLKILLPTGSMVFDATSLAAAVSGAKGSDIRLHLDRIESGALNAAQRSAIQDMDVVAVYDAYMTSNGVRISDFKGGTAVVTVACGLEGREALAWYVANDGNKTAVPTSCGSRTVGWTAEHFSNYVIAYDTPERVERPGIICPKDTTCPISPYRDTRTTAWYHDGVHYVIENRIMQGMGKGIFAPRGVLTRAQMAMILWNMEGRPTVSNATYFKDVKPGHWYTDVVRWAAAEGIMDGYGGSTFGPNDILTREQLVTILYRYAQRKGVNVSRSANLASFEDANAVRSWAASAFEWAVAAGAVNGKTPTSLAPQDSATRAEIATIIMRYLTEIVQ